MNGGRVRVLRYLVVAAAMVLGALALAQPASATTFCVPAFFADCPNSGGNVQTANLETALTQSGSDGTPDTVHIDEFTYTKPDSIEASGTDDLTVLGSGREKSIITSSSTGNIYVLQTNNRFGQVTMKDLSVVVPQSFQDGNSPGSALQAGNLNLESVDFINENTGNSSAISNLNGGGSFDDVHIFGRNGNGFDRGIDGDFCSAATLAITNSEIVTEGLAINSKCKTRPIVVERSDVSSAGTAFSVGSGSTLEVVNTIIRGGDFSPVQLYNNSAAATNVKLDHVTALALGDNTVGAITAFIPNNPMATAGINVQVSNSIIAGYLKTWDLEAPTDPSRGNVNALFSYSNFAPTGDIVGEAIAGQGDGNLNETPGFVDITDFHLSPTSPMVDAGDPNATLPELDFEGNSRPIDGNYDGTAIRDMGAYELNPPPQSCPEDPTVCPDKTRPKVTKVRFAFKTGKGGAVRMKLSERARVRVALVPLPKGKGMRKKVVLVRKQAKAGALRLKLGKKKLSKGRYRLVVVATDKAGNKSKPIIRKVRAR